MEESDYVQPDSFAPQYLNITDIPSVEQLTPDKPRENEYIEMDVYDEIHESPNEYGYVNPTNGQNQRISPERKGTLPVPGKPPGDSPRHSRHGREVLIIVLIVVAVVTILIVGVTLGVYFSIDRQEESTQVEDVSSMIPESDQLLTSPREHVTTVGLQEQGDLTTYMDNMVQVQTSPSSSPGPINVGMKFELETYLQVRNPDNLQQATSYNELSLFFKTNEPNGFLTYIGPDARSVQPETDYMYLDVQNSSVVFTYDLGFGPTMITNPRKVDDGMWHEVIVERIGKLATIKVRSPDEHKEVMEGVIVGRTDKVRPPDEPKEVIEMGSAGGSFAVFDLNKNPYNTRFYIGGVPPGTELNDTLINQRFIGSIEDVKFDQVPVNLWNFICGNNLNEAYARDALNEIDTNGFKFDGNGYVILDKKNYNTKEYAKVQFNFKTFSQNGLMFLMGLDGGVDFFAVELEDGKVKLTYDLGSGAGTVTSETAFNDGQWHTVSGERDKRQGLLKVDGNTVGSLESTGMQGSLETSSYLYIGGFRGTHNFGKGKVTNQGFEGCIQNFYLGPNLKNMNNHVEAGGILPGCPQIARVVSFSAETTNSYIAMDPVSVDRDFEMTFKVKTTERDGLLFYATDDTIDQNDAFSVSILDGKISVTGTAEHRRTTLETNNNLYNNGAWHYITVTKEGKDLQLHIDDSEMVSTSIDGKKTINATTPLYFGGVPPGYNIVPANVRTETNFIGCIGDVTVNGEFINFATAPLTNQRGVLLGRCPIEDPTPAPTTEPFLPPSNFCPGS